jgi:hypothetical protein
VAQKSYWNHNGRVRILALCPQRLKYNICYKKGHRYMMDDEVHPPPECFSPRVLARPIQYIGATSLWNWWLWSTDVTTSSVQTHRLALGKVCTAVMRYCLVEMTLTLYCELYMLMTFRHLNFCFFLMARQPLGGLGRLTLGRTPLDKWSARRRDLYLTTHNTHKRETSMP